MSAEQAAVRKRIHRPPATATWEHNHRWGSQLGDSTDLRVTRTDGGGLSIAYGRSSVEVRGDLVAVLAAMVADAAEWSDSSTLDAEAGSAS